MTICGGDVIQYNELRRMSVREYLIKLEDFVTRIEK